MKWFKHDSNANTDAKLRKLRLKYGMEGYGLYWYCLELIADRVDRKNLTFELEHDAEIIAHDTGIHYERVQEMMTDMVKLGLFENNTGAITCIKMALRLDETTSKHPDIKALQDSIRTQYRQSPDSVPIVSGQSPAITEEIRTEEKRLEETKPSVGLTPDVSQKKKFSKPKIVDVQMYCYERKNTVDPHTFIDFYESNGWKVGKNPMKDWRAAVRTWEKRNQNGGHNAKPSKLQIAAEAIRQSRRNSREPIVQDVGPEPGLRAIPIGHIGGHSSDD